jgi:thiol-disulfide isomerase/thioredoxin
MADDLLVACLCAEWCTTCREYRERLEQVRLGLPEVKFVWVDIEDEAELVSPIEVENFPTVLIAVGSEARYFGPLTPQPETLERLLRSVDRMPGLVDAEIAALLQRIRSAPRPV